MPKPGFAVVVVGFWAPGVKDEVRVGMRESANWLDEVTVVPFGAGREVGCEEDLARSVDVWVRDNKSKVL